MKRDSSDSSNNQAINLGQEGKYKAKKSGKCVDSTQVSASQFFKEYDRTIEKNRETDWLNSNQPEYPSEPVHVTIQPKKEVRLPTFWKDAATSNQKKQDNQQQASEKTQDVVSQQLFKDNLLNARKKMSKIAKQEVNEKATVSSSTPPKIEIHAKTTVAQQATKEGQPIDTPAIRLANNQTKETNKANTEKPNVLNPAKNISQTQKASHPFGQTQGFSFNPTIHNRQQTKPFPNATLITPSNPIAALTNSSRPNQPSISINQPQAQSHSQPQFQLQPQPHPQTQTYPQPPTFHQLQSQFQVQPKREQKGQSKLYNNPQWLNFRAALYQLLKNKSLNDRMLDILTVFTFPDQKYLSKEEIEPVYRQIVDLGNICYDAKEKKKQFLSKQQLGFSPLDKKKVGFDLKDYLQSLTKFEPSRDFSKDSVMERIEQENMVEVIEQLSQTFSEMTLATFIELYTSCYCDYQDNLLYLTEKTVKTMQVKHKIDALLSQLEEEQVEEQFESMMDRFERIKEKQDTITTILTRITQSLNVNQEELPKSVLNYEIEDLETSEKEEERLRGEMGSWKDQLYQCQQGQPYKKIVNSFCECSIALVKRVEEIEAKLNALSSNV